MRRRASARRYWRELPLARQRYRLHGAPGGTSPHAISVYTLGNLQNSTYWLFGLDPFPSFGDAFFLGFYPLLFAGILNVLRAAEVRVQWARLALDATILILGFGAFFWYIVIEPTTAADHDPDVVKYVLTQSYIALNSVMLLAFGVLLMHAGNGPISRRTLLLLTIGFSAMFLADIVWALSKVTGTYLPGACRTLSTSLVTPGSLPQPGNSCGTSRRSGARRAHLAAC